MTKEKTKSTPAASLKLLGGAIPEFKVCAKVPRADGTVAEINVTAEGMRKSAWAKLRDEHMAAARDKAKDEGEFTFARMVNAGARDAAELISKVAKSWDLEDELTVDNLVELEDVLPGALTAILSDIDAGLFQGRVGN